MVSETPRVRAAQYVRMSTERQDFSIPFQKSVLAAYAIERDYVIVQTYADAGISGLRLDRRDGLKKLLSDVLSGDPGFEVVIVYDVSRWGRFQNPDQAAYYEFMCFEAGVRIEYCAEHFDNDGSVTSALLKSLKRAMAAEFSRDLSLRTSRSKRSLGELGYWVAGRAGYGLRRCYLPPGGPAVLMEYGQQKPYRTGRTALVLGPTQEGRIVRTIFRSFIRDRMTLLEIATALNAKAVPAEDGGRWTAKRVNRVLRNETYAGVTVIQKSRMFLGSRTEIAPESWLRVRTSFRPIISRKMFSAAQDERRQRWRAPSDEELLGPLREIFAREGRVSLKLIARHSPYGYQVYALRFGGIVAAYAAAGLPVTPAQTRTATLRVRSRKAAHSDTSDLAILRKFRAVLEEHGRLSVSIIASITGGPTRATLARRFGGLAHFYDLVGYAPDARQQKYLGQPAWTRHAHKLGGPQGLG